MFFTWPLIVICIISTENAPLQVRLITGKRVRHKIMLPILLDFKNQHIAKSELNSSVSTNVTFAGLDNLPVWPFSDSIQLDFNSNAITMVRNGTLLTILQYYT